MLRSIVVYESIFGNTEKIARAISEALADYGDAWAVDVLEAKYGIPDDVDLLVVGGPTHIMGMSRGLSRRIAHRNVDGVDLSKLKFGVREWLRKLPRAKGQAAAAFDTSVPKSGRLPAGGAARGISSELRRKGYKLVVEPEVFYVEEGYEGPLKPGELDRARMWATNLVRQEESVAA